MLTDMPLERGSRPRRMATAPDGSQKAFWGEKLFEMKQLGIEYRPEWAAKAK